MYTLAAAVDFVNGNFSCIIGITGDLDISVTTNNSVTGNAAQLRIHDTLATAEDVAFNIDVRTFGSNENIR